jgi:hypothetical protein
LATLAAVAVVIAAGWLVLSRIAARWSERDLREMREAFTFLQEYGMACTKAVDQGMGAIIEFRGPDLWLKLYRDRRAYYWEYGLVDQLEYHFEPHEFCSTLQQARQFGGKSVRVLGELTRVNFPPLIAALRSPETSEIVRRRKAKAASELRHLLGPGDGAI